MRKHPGFLYGRIENGEITCHPEQPVAEESTHYRRAYRFVDA